MGANHPAYGDIRRMGELADRIGELAQIPSRISKAVADRLSDLIAEQFEEGVDPYGRPWAALAERTLRKHDEPALQAEFGGQPGPMAESARAFPMRGAGVALTVDFPGGIHQTGAKRGAWRMPKRAILPDEGELPEAWARAIETELDLAFGRSAKGGR